MILVNNVICAIIMICIVTSLSVTFVMYFNWRNQDSLFILFIYYQGIQPYPRQRSASIMPLTFEFSVWLDHNGGIDWVLLGDFGAIFSSSAAVSIDETTSLYHSCLRGMGGLQAEMFLRVVLMLGFVSFWQICPSGESITKPWCWARSR